MSTSQFNSSLLDGASRASPPFTMSADDSPFCAKRRRLSGSVSPPTHPAVRGSHSPPMSLSSFLGDSSMCDVSSCSVDVSTADDSSTSAAVVSPGGRKRYRKDELWAAIRSDYHYLMGEEIIETCKSTESDLSWESDEHQGNTNVSFAEFEQQYKELTDWLNQVQLATKRQISSLSEKYLNQTYYEEMLERCPRKKLFNGYAKQLIRRYPEMKNDVQARMQRLNGQWAAVERDILPTHDCLDEGSVLADLEQDLTGLRQWLNGVEGRIRPLTLHHDWTTDELKEKLSQHEILQKEIESQSKVVNAVLKLCERLRTDPARATRHAPKRHSLELLAGNLQQCWHAVWLQSLEWQCRLEEAIKGGKRGPQFWGRSLYSIGEGDGCRADETADSDCSVYDTIPFSENEYEKIVEVAPLDVTGNVNDGSDSAIARSLSDSSDHPQMAYESPPSPPARMSKRDSRDVGYSSESYSNEEAEKAWKGGQSAAAVMTLEVGGSRHSMTSAYDTSSTCSDVNAVAEGGQHFYQLTSLAGDSDVRRRKSPHKSSLKLSPQNTRTAKTKLAYGDVDPETAVDLSHDAEEISYDLSVGQREAVARLVDQAELLVRGTETPWKMPRGTRHRHRVAANKSFTSTDGSVQFTTEDSELSSCDASAEVTESESEVSFADNRYSSGVVSEPVARSPQKRRLDPSGGSLVNQSASFGKWTEAERSCLKLRRTCSEVSPVKHQDGGLSPRRRYRGRASRWQSTPRPTGIEQQVPEWLPREGSTEEIRISVTSGRYKNNALTSDDTDGVVPTGGAVSTVESFSEHAWDSYQEAPYASPSDDPNEEKLDASQLQADWEHGLTSEDDDSFRLDDHYSKRHTPSPQKVKEKRYLGGKFSTNMPVDDSDSDLDDFHYVIAESQKAIKFTQSTLNKTCRDVMETGICLDPAEYVEPLATCETNMRCLQAVIDTLQSQEGVDTNITEQDIERVHEVIREWRDVEAIAKLRHGQSEQLAQIYQQLQTADATLHDVVDSLQVELFSDVDQLEAAIKTLHSQKLEITMLKSSVSAVSDAIADFQQSNVDVPMEKFVEDVTSLHDDLDDVFDRLTLQVSQLQSTMLTWHNYNETLKELEYQTSKERQRLQCLQLATDCVSISPTEIQETSAELKAMGVEFTSYEHQLVALRQHYEDLAPVCSDATAMQAAVAMATHSLQALQQQRSEMHTALEAKMATAEVSCKSMEVPTKVKTSQTTRTSSSGSSWSLFLRLLRWAVPLALALLAICYLAEPVGLDLGIIVNPELRYVRGPPPT